RDSERRADRSVRPSFPTRRSSDLTAGGAQVSFQLSCPKRFVVAGLDAELSRSGVDVTFRGSLGTPVNPGITTSRSAEFLARLLRSQEHTSELQSLAHLVCRLLLEK